MIYLVIFCQYDFFYNPSPVCLPVLRGQCFIGLLEISVEDFPECFWIHPGWLEFNNGGVGKLFFQTGIFLFIIFVRDPAFLEEDIKAFQLFFDSFRIFTLFYAFLLADNIILLVFFVFCFDIVQQILFNQILADLMSVSADVVYYSPIASVIAVCTFFSGFADRKSERGVALQQG